jgi:hypothetical protein
LNKWLLWAGNGRSNRLEEVDCSSIKAMTIKSFLLARLEKKRRPNRSGSMVVMGGLQMTLSLRVCVAGT